MASAPNLAFLILFPIHSAFLHCRNNGKQFEINFVPGQSKRQIDYVELLYLCLQKPEACFAQNYYNALG